VIRKVLVVGGSGFIGSHLCRRLLAENYLPVVFDRVAPSVEGVEYHRGDMSTIADLWPSLLEDVVTVYHLAWTTKPQSANNDPLFDLQSNVAAGIHLLDGLARLSHRPRFIFVSTGGAVYGQAGNLPVPEDFPTNPISAYGISKLALEHYLQLYHRLHGVDYLVFRPGNPYGEGQDPAGAQGAVAVFLGKIFRGEPVTIWGDGEVVRDYLHIDDLVSALMAGLTYRPSSRDPRTFNIGSGRGVSLNGLVKMLEQIAGRQAQVTYTPGRKADVPHIVLDIGRIREYLGWAPQITMEQGLKRTWDWIASEGGNVL
jgi:UDP-glucose 4-epimerase